MTEVVSCSFQAQIPLRERERVSRLGRSSGGWVEVSTAFQACCRFFSVLSVESRARPARPPAVPHAGGSEGGGWESSDEPCSAAGQTEEVTRHSRWRTRVGEFLRGARLPRQSARQRAASSPSRPPPPLSSCVLPPLSVLRPQIPNSSPHRGANPLRSPCASLISIL